MVQSRGTITDPVEDFAVGARGVDGAGFADVIHCYCGGHLRVWLGFENWSVR